MNLGEYIYQHRVRSDLTLSELADVCDVSKSTLSRIENGECDRVQFETLRKLSKFFNVPIEEIARMNEE